MTRTIDEIKKAKGIRKAVSESKSIAWGGLKKGNVAKGTIVHIDLTETPCYIVKSGNYFAHGATLELAKAHLVDIKKRGY